MWYGVARVTQCVTDILLFCSDEDDTAELLRELQKIRKERKEEEEKKVMPVVHMYTL